MKPFRGRPQQLTLFQAPKPTDAHRWPEGYSPDRRNEVASRLEIIQRGHREGSRYADETGKGEWTNPTPSRGQKNIIADVARSSVPTEHLRHPLRDQEARLQIHARGDMTGGTYFGGYGKIAVGHNASANTTLHEIGHAVSDLTGQPHSAESTPYADWEPPVDDKEAKKQRSVASSMGKEEAFADNYSREHIGARRGETPQPSKSVYEYGAEVFQEGYKMPSRHAGIAFRSYMNARQFAAPAPARGAEPAQMPHGRKPNASGKYWQPEFEQ